jgi:hypothetical protein
VWRGGRGGRERGCACRNIVLSAFYNVAKLMPSQRKAVSGRKVGSDKHAMYFETLEFGGETCWKMPTCKGLEGDGMIPWYMCLVLGR